MRVALFSVPATRIGRRRGRPPSLSREEIARAALEEGLAALSLSSVARRLGVSHSTLYSYVTTRNDLVLAALDLAVGEHSWPQATLPWRELLETFADSLWSFLEAHPGMAVAVMEIAGMPSSVIGLLHRYAARLVECGFTSKDAMLALDFLVDLTVSTAIAMGSLDDKYDTPDGTRTRRELYQRAFFDLASVSPEIAEQTTWTGRGWLDDKLALMLDGLALRLPGR